MASRYPDGLLESWERPEAHLVRDDAPNPSRLVPAIGTTKT